MRSQSAARWLRAPFFVMPAEIAMQSSVVLLEHACACPWTCGHAIAEECSAGSLMSRYVAARLMGQGTSVRIERISGQEPPGRQYADRLVAGGDLLGVHTCYCREHTRQVFELLDGVKALRPDVRVFVYGYFPTFAWRAIMRDFPQVDWIVCGEPEQTCAELAAACGDMQAVAGIARRDCGRLVQGPARAAIADLDMLPFPLRDPGRPQTMVLLGSRGRASAQETSRSAAFYGAPWRGRSPENIAAEVAALLPGLQQPWISFADEDFFGPGQAGQARAREIADRLQDFSLECELTCCPGDVQETTLAALVRAGLRRVRLDIGYQDLIETGRDACSRGLEVLRCHAVEPVPCCVLLEPDAALEDVGRGFQSLRQFRLLEQLPVTLGALGNRRIVLRGMPLFGHLERQGRLLQTNPLAYEALYRFADARVGLLADVMGTVCSRVRTAAAQARSPIRLDAPQSAAGAQINAILVNAFAELTVLLERGELAAPGAAQAKTEDLIGQIEGALVAARVCQS